MTRRLTLLSASGLKLASLCEMSAAVDLERVDIGPVEARATGVAFHSLVEFAVEAGAASARCADEKANALFVSWARHYLPVDASIQRETEVTYCFDVESREWRILGKGLQRRYEEAGIRPTEVPCTIDLVQSDMFAGFRVVDYKTGAQRDREPIEQHKQLRMGACGVARVHQLNEITAVVSYITEDDVEEQYATFSEFDFLRVEDELIELFHAAAFTPKARPGAHCSSLWCSAAASCPAATRALDEVVATASEPVLPSGIVTTNAAHIRDHAHAATLFDRLKAAEAQLKACWKALDDFVIAKGPLDVGSGQTYAYVDKSRDDVTLCNETEAVLEEMLGSALADGAIERSITKKAIAAATKVKVGQGKARTALERQIYAELDARGAIKTAHWKSVELVRARKAGS